jgi:hypothetical protein
MAADVARDDDRDTAVYMALLADGTYRWWRILVTSITDPRTVKEGAFFRQQEAVLKGVERVFGALSAISNIIPSLLPMPYEIHAKRRAGVRRRPQYWVLSPSFEFFMAVARRRMPSSEYDPPVGSATRIQR